jgi:DNA ligase (NAD+)
LDGFQQQSTENLLRSIEKSKSNDLWRLLHGLGIEGVGEVTAKSLAATFCSLQSLQEASREELLKVANIGEKTAESILDYFQHPINHRLIQELAELGVNLQYIEKSAFLTQPMAGLQVVLTGTLQQFSREKAKSLIEKLGGRVSSSVSSQTSFVIAGENPGSKYDRAIALGIPILTEEEWIRQYQITQ